MVNKKHHIVYQITNKINNNIYIGVHVTDNINDKYFGSGTNIKKAIKEFGKENFEKIILYNLDTNEEMLEKERELVNDEFIKRGDTYNIILGGGQHLQLNIVNVKDSENNYMSVHKTDPRYLSGELVHNLTNMVTVKDSEGNMMKISNSDPRYLSGELEYFLNNMVLIKDINGASFMVSTNDPRYLSGELVHFWQGKKHKPETRLKMSNAMKGRFKGEENSQYGTCWIYNLDLEENKKIKKDEINQWLDNGWLKGRKQKYFKNKKPN